MVRNNFVRDSKPIAVDAEVAVDNVAAVDDAPYSFDRHRLCPHRKLALVWLHADARHIPTAVHIVVELQAVPDVDDADDDVRQELHIPVPLVVEFLADSSAAEELLQLADVAAVDADSVPMIAVACAVPPPPEFSSIVLREFPNIAGEDSANDWHTLPGREYAKQ